MKSLKHLGDLHGRVAIITGGAGHIGRALGDALAELGCAIAILDRAGSEPVAQALAKTWKVPTYAVALDLADDKAVARAPAEVVARLGRLDIVIHCAAFVGTTQLTGWVAPFAEQSAATWRLALEVNLTSFFVLAQAAENFLKASTHGSVIGISSIYGMVGPDMQLYEGTAMGNPAAYAASKGGMLQLVRWLSTVMAPDVRVNAITPGGIERGQPVEFQERYKIRAPLRRMATEEDLKGAAAYLASDLSSYVTGQNLVVDGGWTAW